MGCSISKKWTIGTQQNGNGYYSGFYTAIPTNRAKRTMKFHGVDNWNPSIEQNEWTFQRKNGVIEKTKIVPYKSIHDNPQELFKLFNS